MAELLRCKSCGYIVEAGRVGEVCPACGVPRKMMEPWKDPLSQRRRFLLGLDLHPIVDHFSVSFSACAVVVALFLLLFPGFSGRACRKHRAGIHRCSAPGRRCLLPFRPVRREAQVPQDFHTGPPQKEAAGDLLLRLCGRGRCAHLRFRSVPAVGASRERRPGGCRSCVRIPPWEDREGSAERPLPRLNKKGRPGGRPFGSGEKRSYFFKAAIASAIIFSPSAT